MKNHWSKVFPLLFTYLMWMNVEVQAAASEPPQPETAWFQIEVILFEQTEPNRYIEELWPENPIIPNIQDSIDFLSPKPLSEEISTDPATLNPTTETQQAGANNAAGLNSQNTEVPTTNKDEANALLQNIDAAGSVITHNIVMPPPVAAPPPQFETPFVPLDESQIQLSREIAILKRDKHLKILLQTGWRQPVNDADNAQSVRLLGGQDYLDEFQLNGTKRKPEERAISESVSAEAKPVDTDADITLKPNEHCMDNTEDKDLGNELATVQSSTSESSAAPVLEVQENRVVDDKPENLIEQTQSNALESSQKNNKNSPAGLTSTEMPSHLSCAPKLIPHLWELDGLINVRVKRYLHVDFNLVFRHPDVRKSPAVAIFEHSLTPNEMITTEKDVLATENQGLVEVPVNAEASLQQEFLHNYVINHQRRLKSGEINYLDHPLVGILILITPYQPQLIEAEQDPSPDNILSTISTTNLSISGGNP